MAIVLKLYGTNQASTTLSACDQLVTSTGGASTNKNTTIGNTAVSPNGWFQVLAQAGSASFGSSISTPSDSNFKGYFLDSSLLDLQQILGGNWTPTFKHRLTGTGAVSIIADIHVQIWKRSTGGVYVQIGSDFILTSQTIDTSTRTYSFSAQNIASATNFATGDRLGIWEWINITTNNNTASTAAIEILVASSLSGVASTFEIDTPGYVPQSSGGSMNPTIRRARRFVGRTLP